MWDGVHQLEDGSVVIVRQGTAVPTQRMLETWMPVTRGGITDRDSRLRRFDQTGLRCGQPLRDVATLWSGASVT